MHELTTGANAQEMRIIECYLEWLRQRQCTEKTIQGRRETLYRLNRDMKYGIGQVRREELAAWLYRDDWSQNTKATRYAALKSFYGWAADDEQDGGAWLNADPTEGMPAVNSAESVARACTDEQVRDILARVPEPFRTWALLAAYQGLRCVEVSRLDREHVTKQQLFVVRGKGNKPRMHDTDPMVWEAVQDLPPGPIARRPDNGKRASAHYVSAETSYQFKKAGIDTSMHPLRHWLGTTVQREYRDIRVTQRLLGHARLTSTQIYTSASDEQQRAARATLPRFAE